MIKAEVNVTGRIKRSAMVRNDRNGEPCMAFIMAVSLPDKKTGTNEVEIHVTIPNSKQEDLQTYTEDKRVTVSGTLNVKKKDEKMYFYITANLISLEGVSDLDAIGGDLTFRGHLRKEKVYEEKTDKNGNPYLVFSAYSTEKRGEEYINTWINFMRFPDKDANIDTIKPDWMQSKAHVTINGDFLLDSYDGKIRISCRVREMEQYVPQPFNQ